MLSQERLQLAIQIHSKCHGLLKWIDQAIQNGSLPWKRVHEFVGIQDTSQQWFHDYYSILPTEYQPRREHLIEFANYFSTFLTTSFDFADQPRYGQATNCGCFCPWCSYLVQASSLQTKKVMKQDKVRAERLMELRLDALAQEEGHGLEPSILEKLLLPRSHNRRNAAYSTYGYWLLERLKGFTDGVSLLALWREIAYEQSGSPIKGFALRSEDFTRAEAELIDAIKLGQPSAI